MVYSKWWVVYGKIISINHPTINHLTPLEPGTYPGFTYAFTGEISVPPCFFN